MANALVGYTGFVGGNIKSRFDFGHLYNSKNFDEIRGKEFDILVFSGARAEKWLANSNEEADKMHIDELIGNLKAVKANRAILISTVDVYKTPSKVNESSETNFLDNHPYGKHRGQLELFWSDHFSQSHIVRLPGLYGTGLKKNVIFDFLNKNQVEKIDSRGSFQFYNLNHIWDDISKVISREIPLINLTVEPVTVAEVAKSCFGRDFKNEVLPVPASYDIQSKYAELWGGQNGYLYDKVTCLHELKFFVDNYQRV